MIKSRAVAADDSVAWEKALDDRSQGFLGAMRREHERQIATLTTQVKELESGAPKTVAAGGVSVDDYLALAKQLHLLQKKYIQQMTGRTQLLAPTRAAPVPPSTTKKSIPTEEATTNAPPVQPEMEPATPSRRLADLFVRKYQAKNLGMAALMSPGKFTLPLATPVASPLTTPVFTPVATPVATPAETPVAADVLETSATTVEGDSTMEPLALSGVELEIPAEEPSKPATNTKKRKSVSKSQRKRGLQSMFAAAFGSEAEVDGRPTPIKRQRTVKTLLGDVDINEQPAKAPDSQIRKTRASTKKTPGKVVVGIGVKYDENGSPAKVPNPFRC
jgi:hypothetical protein